MTIAAPPPLPPPVAQPQWQTPGPLGGACDAAPAQGAIGQSATAKVMEKARIASGAAMARVLRTGAKLLLLDEITEGLAPVIVKKLGEVIVELKSRGFTIVLVEQNFRFAAPLADRFLVMEHGQVIQEFTQSELPARLERLHEYLGV